MSERELRVTIPLWYLVAGVLLVLVALVASWIRHLPMTTTLIYLLAGVALGGLGLGAVHLEPLRHAALLERLTELAVIVSLFTAGLKFRVGPRNRLWLIPVRLASLSMVLTVALVAVVGVYGLGLPLGAAILLGAILAPTDPVLASDVQIEKPGDRDRLRFGLTGEAGLNDGTAFPFVMLGLGLLGAHELGAGWWRWLAVDVAWAVVGGLALGFGLGWVIGHLALRIRRRHGELFGLDDFMALGLIGTSYGAALLLHAYGFLAVFAAGLALRQIDRIANPGDDPPLPQVLQAADEIGAAPEKAASFMAQSVLGFNEQIERLLEVAVVVTIGIALVPRYLPLDALWFVPVLFLGVRPLAVVLGLLGAGMPRREEALVGWFGIRGIGSIYYLMYAVTHGLAPALAERLVGLTLTTVVASIALHGISVTPLMKLYDRRR